MAIDMAREEERSSGGTGGSGPNKSTSVFKFDHSRVSWQADSDIISSDSSASDLIGSLLSKAVSSSGSSLDVDDEGRLLGSRSGGSAEFADDGSGTTVLNTQEGLVRRPDGTIECPVAWDGMSVDEPVAQAQAPP